MVKDCYSCGGTAPATLPLEKELLVHNRCNTEPVMTEANSYLSTVCCQKCVYFKIHCNVFLCFLRLFYTFIMGTKLVFYVEKVF